ncbi:hypothetical protein [Clostridium botulinum]|uniref:hypothetical protein n=1 Tax=Clostridium botulinum TaxID=1491 RepID=UPI001C9A6A54|nr:hypothetical protein [Clostridium botulinum]MBY6842822.1 hypothetical protein [Clostridium botulinum]
MKKDIKEMIEVAEELGWVVSINDNEFTFLKYSPKGQDFNFDIEANSLEEAVEKIQERCDNFDCSEETYLWLDNTGHGTKGAPYDMKDLYEDMEACLKMMDKLRDELVKIN